MPTITPFLWFDGTLEEAAAFYVSIFGDATILSTSRGADGRVTSMTFELQGQRFMALNGGPHFAFTGAISFFVSCKTQSEVDYFWSALSEGGALQRCGWLKDKFGLSWQVVPEALGAYLNDSDADKSRRVMQAMLKMTKIEIAGLDEAYAG